ncbi:MAG: METTL5 family protein [Promethearchaeota archaeon]
MAINKKEIVFRIQKTETFSNPKIELEQYSIDASCAVDIIFFAGFEFNDINQKLIIDLGTGTGRLSIASAFFHPIYVLSVDVDMNALSILKKNIKKLQLEDIIFPICSDVKYFELSKFLLPKNLKITTIMNPPFGVKKKSADRIFLERAFAISDIIYSIHLANKGVNNFISKFIRKFNWKIDYILPFNMILVKSFEFHKHKNKEINVNLYRFIK